MSDADATVYENTPADIATLRDILGHELMETQYDILRSPDWVSQRKTAVVLTDDNSGDMVDYWELVSEIGLIYMGLDRFARPGNDGVYRTIATLSAVEMEDAIQGLRLLRVS